MNKKFHLLLMTLLLAFTADSEAWYDPSTATFLSRDPIREAGGAALYGYCNNQPIGNYDPIGLSARMTPYGVEFDDSDPTPSFIQSRLNQMAVKEAVFGIKPIDREVAWAMQADAAFRTDFRRNIFLGTGIVLAPIAWAFGPELAAGGLTLAETSAAAQVAVRIGSAAGAGTFLYESAANPDFRGQVISLGPAAALTDSVLAGSEVLGAGRFLPWAANRGFVGLPVELPAAKGLTSGADEAVFWSGIGRGGADKAAAWVGQNSGATLETTLAARGIKLPVWDASNPASVAAWRQASKDFAAGASGNVRVLQGDALRLDAIWVDEFKALQANPNVNSIMSINPTTGADVLLWSR